jgi:hypothetical protein
MCRGTGRFDVVAFPGGRHLAIIVAITGLEIEVAPAWERYYMGMLVKAGRLGPGEGRDLLRINENIVTMMV